MEYKFSVAQYKQLKKTIMSHPNYSLDDLKNSLLVQSNFDFLYLLEKSLLREIGGISYVKNATDYRWLCTCLKYIIEIISKDSKTHTSEHFYMIERIKNNILVKKKYAPDTLPNNLKFFFEDILNILKPLTKILDKQTKEERKKAKEKEESNNLYHFAEILIYKFKKFDYFYQIAKTYPYLINSVNEKNIPLIDSLVRKQVKNLKNNGNRENIDYYYRVINFITSSNYLNITNKQLTSLLTYLKSELYHLQEQPIMNVELVSFIEELISVFKVKTKSIGVSVDYRELFKKYDIKEANDNFNINIIIPKIYLADVEDFTDKNVITMDLSKNIRLYDDAISCECLPNGNFLVGVYIADLTDIIVPNTEFDYFVYNRCETIYLEDRAIDMLPNEVSSNYSLHCDQNRKVIAYMFEFTKDASLYDFKVKSAIINVKNNLTFNNAQKLYHMNHHNEHGKIIKNLIKLSEQLAKSNFYNENYHILKEEKRKYEEKDEYHINNDCSKALATFMILVNSSIAKFFADNNYPFLYRVNSSNVDSEMIKKLQHTIKSETLPSEIHKLIDKLYSRSSYSYNNTGHHGLGLGFYCHVTNPLRSYASVITQRMVKQEFINGGLDDKELYNYEQILPQVASYLNKTIDTHNIFIEEYNKIKRKK